MRVYLSGSSRAMGEDLPYLRRMIQAINATQATITRNWIETANARRIHGIKDEDADWGSIYTENIEAINRSDMAIIESTRNRFSQGFWVYAALRNKLPTLVVTRRKEHLALYRFSSKYITVKLYQDESELEKIISKFIKSNDVSVKDLRFNFFIDRQIYSYLREVSYETGKNKSEIIRDLLEQEIDGKG